MKRLRPWRRIAKAAVLFAGLALLHAVLIRWAAHRDVAAAILSGGPHTPVGDLALAAGLMAVRLALIVLAPALLMRDVVVIVLAWRSAGRRRRDIALWSRACYALPPHPISRASITQAKTTKCNPAKVEARRS